MDHHAAHPQGLASGAGVRLEHLSVAFGEVKAVDDICLDIAHGELMTLLGPSGSGKTTAMMAIAGFVEPSAGAIHIGGREIGALPPHRRSVGVVFQHYALFPHMSVADNVAFPLRMRAVPEAELRQRVTRVLDLVQLGQFGARFPSQLSGGQQQRIALARAVVFDPPVLLLDEPLGALDKNLREEMQVELKALQRHLGITTIMVTHDQTEALAISDRIAVMDRGRIEQIGTPQDLYESPASLFTARFIGDSTVLHGSVARAQQGGFSFITQSGLDLAMQAQARTATGPSVLVLRPELLRLGAPLGARNAYDGRIVERASLGSETRYKIQIASGDLFLYVEKLSPHRIQHNPGDTVSISWDPKDAAVFKV